MKTNKKTILSALLALPLALASCSRDSEPASENGAESLPPSGDYPLTTCVVSGEELGSMGTPIEYDHDGTLVKFCCKSCLPKFQKDPEKYLTKLKKAEAEAAGN